MKHIILTFAVIVATFALAQNRDYCRVATNGVSLVFAPDTLSPSWATPTDADYLAAGWLRNAVSAATNRVGYTARLDHYEARGAAVYAVYEYVPIPWTPRRIYKYDLSKACDEQGVLNDFITLISYDTKTRWFYDQAEIILESDEFFVAMTNGIISSGAMSQSQVNDILDRAYALGTNTVSEVTK